MNLLDREESCLADFVGEIRKRFSSRLREIALFGSRARGTAREDSDIDVLVVVDGLSGAEARDIAYLCGDMLTRTDVLISAFAVSSDRMQELRRRERLIASEIDRDGVPL